MPDREDAPDLNAEAAKLVQIVTGTEPDRGEDLLGSEELKRQLREAKAREKKASGKN